MRAHRLANLFAVLGMCVMLAAPALTQETKEAKPAEAGMAMVPPKPGPEHALLAKHVGKWKAMSKATWEPGKPPEISEGTEECTLICNGLFLRSDYQAKGEQGDFYGSGILGYDTNKKKYVGVWVDNFDTKPYPYEGTCDQAGKCTFTMEVMGQDGKPTTAMMTSENIDANIRKFTMMMPGPDGKMFTCMEITYTRI